MKTIIRILILYILAGHLIAVLLAPYSSKELERLMHPKDLLVIIWGGLYLLSIFFVWIYLFRHWGMSLFNSSFIKRMWFWILLIGGFLYLIGPIIYYVVVFEMGKGAMKHSEQE